MQTERTCKSVMGYNEKKILNTKLRTNGQIPGFAQGWEGLTLDPF